MAMSDHEYLAALMHPGSDCPPHLDAYAFSERVSLKLEGIDQPTDAQIDAAREQAFINV